MIALAGSDKALLSVDPVGVGLAAHQVWILFS